ncbi:hypothetical protein OGAPHI_005179 [Ogataea philodendri]|uniref:Uncharacterized protein n=1 Tax=Ogataea philodendri TaxID=1378263 RepID=A0A9P8P2G1_9ASCO|nr:uncharacterized protein OGAPHI_005179 [Ogataea philodendri]KAH3663776.1 hypothetical protein OGAPHI_005179 [Ogataea philodendri]
MKHSIRNSLLVLGECDFQIALFQELGSNGFDLINSLENGLWFTDIDRWLVLKKFVVWVASTVVEFQWVTRLELTAGLNLAFELRLIARVRFCVLNQLDNRLSRNHLTENNVFSVKMRRWNGGDEELRSVCVLARVGHRQQKRLIVFKLKVLVLKLLAIYGLAPGTIEVGKVTTLDHEALDHTVENRSFVSKPWLARGQGAEVLCCFRNNIIEKLKGDTTNGLTANGNVKIHLGPTHLRAN